MFTAALFTTAKTCKQSNCPPTDEWIKMWYIYTTEYYSVLKNERRKAMTNLDSVLKTRDLTLQTKVHIVKAMVIPEVMYGCERWTIKKVECWKIDAFELWCWRRLLRVPWTARRFNQSILKEISPEYSSEGLMLKLKLWPADADVKFFTWCEEVIHWKRPRCWKRLKTGGEGDNRGWDGWMASLTQWTWVWANSGRWWRTGKPGVLQSMGSQVGQNLASEQQFLSQENILGFWAGWCLHMLVNERQTDPLGMCWLTPEGLQDNAQLVCV